MFCGNVFQRVFGISSRFCCLRGGKGREGKGREGKGREGKGREGKGREGRKEEGAACQCRDAHYTLSFAGEDPLTLF